ncbi:MAG: DNA-3-methyladenine glycosylase 2 family protein [Pseudomonadota bacterium]|nr:DNA-3-methyladenine glycosylase 2 family protein [Pseudomonadota bacterium]
MVPATLTTAADLERGIAALCRVEPRFAGILARAGTPSLRPAAGGFETLARIIVEQSISLKAASAIHGRLSVRVRPLDPATLSRARLRTLRDVGLTYGKARAMKALAAAIVNGKLELEGLAVLSDAEAVTALTQLPGIGPWTAHIYLLTALGRADAWPCADVALQIAVADAFGLGERPSLRTMEAIGEPWRPWRAVAARLLWAHYRLVRAMPPAS